MRLSSRGHRGVGHHDAHEGVQPRAHHLERAALVGLHATGGSTNHTIHLVAMARAAGLVIDWNGNTIDDSSLAWGFRWDGVAYGETMIQAVIMADPPMYSDRLPMLPMPWATSLSPCTITTRSGSTPSVSQTICT